MNKRQWIQTRRPHWTQFEKLLQMHSGRTGSFKPKANEISTFSRLLRELSNDLSIVRTRSWGIEIESYLNHLVGQGHTQFYSAPPGHLALFVEYLSVGFPQLFRANVGYFVVAAILFFLPGAVSWAVIQNNPSLAGRIISSQVQDQFDTMYGESDENESPTQRGFGEDRAVMAGFYVQHNVGIALDCFARGVLLGVGTAYTLLFNGISIGAVGGYIVSQGHSERFLSFVVSHGSFELTAIAVAGGAGLMLGNALLHPGQRTRFEALRVRGLEAVQIACGAAAMLVVAAFIEAFWSPSGVPVALKYIVGTMLWALVFLYLSMSGRNK